MNDTDRIAEIRARADAATAGPGYAQPDDAIGGWCITAAGISPANGGTTVADFMRESDATFYGHAHSDVRWLLDQLEQARTARDTAAAAVRDRETLRAKTANENRRLVAEAAELRTELAAAEEARQAWAKTAQEQLAEARAQRDEALRELRTESAERLRLAEAIQRVRDIPMKGDQVASDEWEEGYLACEADVQRALDGEVPDGN